MKCYENYAYFKEWKTYDWDDDEVDFQVGGCRREFIDAFRFIMNIGWR